jgi:hypothetical protein
MDASRRKVLLKEYSEACNNFRLLTDIRFKLLAFLPIAAAAAILSNDRATVPGLALSPFGLVVTLGLVTYNKRNDQLDNELVGRASTIERNLVLPDGRFANRSQAWPVVRFRGKKWKVDHGIGVGTIYRASVAFAFRRLRFEPGVGSSGLTEPRVLVSTKSLRQKPSIRVSIAALGLAVLSTYGANRMVKSQRKCRERKMGRLTRAAVEAATPFDLPGILDNDEFIKVCAQLSEDNEEEKEEREKKEGEIRARLEFYA